MFDTLELLLESTKVSAQVTLFTKTDLGANEERIEFRKHSEHLIRISGSSKSVPQPCNDLILDPRHPFVVSILGRYPYLSTL